MFTGLFRFSYLDKMSRLDTIYLINIDIVTGKLRHNSRNDIFEGNQDMLKERGKLSQIRSCIS